MDLKININEKEINIINNYSYLTIFLPFSIIDEYEGDIPCYSVYNLTFFNIENMDFLGGILLDLPELITFEKLKELCTIYSQKVLFSVVSCGYMNDYCGGSISDLVVDFEMDSIALNNIFRVLVGFENYRGEAYTIVHTFLKRIKNIDFSIFPLKPTRELRERVLKRDSYKCVECGSTENLTVHHIRPRSSFGVNTEDNLITLCRDCHDKKHEKDYSHQTFSSYLKKDNVVKSILSHQKVKDLLPNVDFLEVPEIFEPSTLNDFLNELRN